MGGRGEVSIISYRPVTRSNLKQERSFFRGCVSILATGCRNSLKSLAVSSDSESEVEPFITQTSTLSDDTAIELSEKIFESSFAGADNEQKVDNFNFRTKDLSTYLHGYR